MLQNLIAKYIKWNQDDFSFDVDMETGKYFLLCRKEVPEKFYTEAKAAFERRLESLGKVNAQAELQAQIADVTAQLDKFPV